jgi:16S rRNA processing protein RimM
LPPLGEGEYYHADLVGLPCVDDAGSLIGSVAAIENFGAGDLIEVLLPSGKRSLIPFREPIAVLGEDRIVLDPDFLA